MGKIFHKYLQKNVVVVVVLVGATLFKKPKAP